MTTIPPDEEFRTRRQAAAGLCARAGSGREAFWAEDASRLHWATRWDAALGAPARR